MVQGTLVLEGDYVPVNWPVEQLSWVINVLISILRFHDTSRHVTYAFTGS